MKKVKKTAHEIFADILQKIQPIDFRKKADVKTSKQQLTDKHLLVIIVEETKNAADEAMYGLCKHFNFVYLYNGAYWQQISIEELADFLSLCAQKMGIDFIESKYYNFKEKLVKQFMSSSDLKKPNTDSKILINLQNGTFEFDPDLYNSLRHHSKADFLTYQLGFEYDERAQAPIFQKFLDRVLPEEELQLFLAEYLGYIFTKKKQLNLEMMLFCYGNGSNGKSVLFGIVSALLGKENVSNYSLQNLTSDRGYQRAKIADKLVNYASEISVKLEQSVFKLLSSGEPVEARLPYGEPFIMDNYAKFIFNCNELPRDVEQTNAFFRRIMPLPFRIEIKEDERDTQLATKIIESELSGIFNWVLVGLERLLKNKAFTKSAIVEQLQKEYRTSSDSVLLYIEEEGFKPSLDNTLTLKTLYESYKAFSLDYGLRPVSAKTLAERLRQKGYMTDRNSQGTLIFLEKV
jgi:putative DNA primase/helicase